MIRLSFALLARLKAIASHPAPYWTDYIRQSGGMRG